MRDHEAESARRVEGDGSVRRGHGVKPARWRRYINGLLAAELSALCRYVDRVVEWLPRPGSAGSLLEAITAPEKWSVATDEPFPDLSDESSGRTAVLINGSLNHETDIQGRLQFLRAKLARGSRVLVVLYNPYMRGLYWLANRLGIRRGELPETFVTRIDLQNLARISGFEVVRQRHAVFVPWRLLGFGTLLNRVLPIVPVLRWFSLVHVAVLRPQSGGSERPGISCVIPARNERGNIEVALARFPDLRCPTEILFVEGHSEDGTWEEIQRVAHAYTGRFSVVALRQTGEGKADAVRLGFSRATQPLLAILDADLTVPPEMLTRFYDAYLEGHGDFVNGSRLVYPMEGAAMRFLNRLGNVFFAKSLSWVLDSRIGDSLCGTKLLSRDDYQRIVTWRREFGDFDPFGDFELLFPAAELGLGIVDVPVRYRARTYGSTNIRRFRHGLQLLRMTWIGLLRLKLGKAPRAPSSTAEESVVSAATTRAATGLGARSTAVLLAVPLALTLLAGVLVEARGPFSLNGNLDPDYNYLLNSLNVLTMQAPGHTDHPGTTLQVIGAAPVLLRWLAAKLAGDSRSLSEAVLGDPEAYLRAIQAGLGLIVAAASFLAGRRATLLAGSLAPGVVLQLSVLLFASPLRSLASVSPEPLLVAAVYLLLTPVLPLVLSGAGGRFAGGPAVGAALGFGLVTKVTFLPLGLLLGLLSDWRRRARSAVVAAITAAVLLIPIWTQLPRVWQWMYSLLVHSGQYGGGSVGLPSLEALRQNLHQILNSEPLLPAWLVLHLGALAALRYGVRGGEQPADRAATRALWLSCAVVVLQVALATKHFVSPRYLVPGLVAMALPNVVLVRALTGGGLVVATRWTLAVAALALSIASVGQASSAVWRAVERQQSHRAAAVRLAEARDRLGDCLTIGYYSSSGGHFALGFGSEYSRGVHAQWLNRLYPGTVIYQRFAGEFIGFGWAHRNQRVAEMLAQGRCILMQGWPMSAADLKLPRQFQITELLREGNEAVYRLSLIDPYEPVSKPRRVRKRRGG